MTKREINALLKKIATAKKKLSDQRDILRELESEANELGDDLDEANYKLEDVVDALSRLL